MNRAGALARAKLCEYGQNLVLAQDQDVLALEPDVRARVLPEQDLVAHLHIQGDLGAVVEDLAVADAEHLALLGLLLGRIGDDDPSLRGLLLLDAANDQTIVQRAYFHGVLLLYQCPPRPSDATECPSWTVLPGRGAVPPHPHDLSRLLAFDTADDLRHGGRGRRAEDELRGGDEQHRQRAQRHEPGPGR